MSGQTWHILWGQFLYQPWGRWFELFRHLKEGSDAPWPLFDFFAELGVGVGNPLEWQVVDVVKGEAPHFLNLEQIHNKMAELYNSMHIFPKAQVTSNKNAHKFRHHFWAHFLILFHMTWSILFGVLALETTFPLVEIFQEPITNFHCKVFKANTP